MAPNMSQTPDCTNLTWHWYWTTNPVGATNTRSKKKKQDSRTRDSAQYVYTIHTYPTSQTNKSSGTPSSTKGKHYTMDSHYQRQWQTWLLIRQTNHNTYATISNSFFSNIRDIRHTITNLPHQKGSNCFLKKKNKRKREWGRRVHQHEAPTPSGSIKNQLPPKKKKEGERAETRQLRIEE